MYGVKHQSNKESKYVHVKSALCLWVQLITMSVYLYGTSYLTGVPCSTKNVHPHHQGRIFLITEDALFLSPRMLQADVQTVGMSDTALCSSLQPPCPSPKGWFTDRIYFFFKCMYIHLKTWLLSEGLVASRMPVYFLKVQCICSEGPIMFWRSVYFLKVKLHVLSVHTLYNRTCR